MSIEVQNVAPLLQVFDMPRSIHFYRDLLGFKVTGKSKEKSLDPDDVDWAMLQLSSANIMLNAAYDPEEAPVQPEPSRWSGHQDTCLYFSCPDIAGAYQHLILRGLQLDPPRMTWYGMKQVHIKDPDGFGICFQWFA
jgi:glyoxylase I family protein